jgi:hypothetical protein
MFLAAVTTTATCGAEPYSRNIYSHNSQSRRLCGGATQPEAEKRGFLQCCDRIETDQDDNVVAVGGASRAFWTHVRRAPLLI